MDSGFVDHNFVNGAEIGSVSSAGDVNSTDLIDLVDHEQRATSTSAGVNIYNETRVEDYTGLGGGLSRNVHDAGARNFHELGHLEFSVSNFAESGELARIDFDIGGTTNESIDDGLLSLELRE